jgi:hypothetical protein
MHGHRIKALPKPEEFVSDGLAERLDAHGPASGANVSVVVTRSAGEAWWTGRASISTFLEWPDGHHYGRHGGNVSTFWLDMRSRIIVVSVSAWRAGTASRAGVDIAVPFVLAAIAALACLYQLAFFFSK